MFSNKIKEATLETSLPKFLIDVPVDVVCEDCVGSTIALGDFPITFNGEEYTLAGSELFWDPNNSEAGFVPYEGQEANLHYVAQWWENGEKIILTACEYDPTM